MYPYTERCISEQRTFTGFSILANEKIFFCWIKWAFCYYPGPGFHDSMNPRCHASLLVPIYMFSCWELWETSPTSGASWLRMLAAPGIECTNRRLFYLFLKGRRYCLLCWASDHLGKGKKARQSLHVLQKVVKLRCQESKEANFGRFWEWKSTDYSQGVRYKINHLTCPAPRHAQSSGYNGGCCEK